MIKAVFFDIDGTLVSFETHKIPDSTVYAIEKLKSKGIKVFIASGRQFEAINNLGNLTFDGYITLNGSYCMDENKKVIYRHSIPQADIQSLINYIKNKHSFSCVFVREHDSFANYLDNSAIEVFQMLNFPIQKLATIQPIEKALEEDIYQVISFFKKENEAEIMSFLPNCEATRWSPLFIDLIPKGSSKKVGIDKILEYYNISLDETMAFGDGGNDISMLRRVKIGVAMGNAEISVQNEADYVTDSVDKDGILNALVHFNIL